ncbi:hypothetical protein RJ639_017493 [Escallonia herrerae]|uniref:Retrovirus-related Pol polyprotein from transposon TNT 1-94 n=1 Tax=Escallonia herrerae TaxID=1293975 RepID=A0AA89AJM3_9ASTE|nr:hypothetical protein RJ639_017493 [Escallonia herrerae]
MKEIKSAGVQLEVIYVGRRNSSEHVRNILAVIDEDDLYGSLTLIQIKLFWLRLESMRKSLLNLGYTLASHVMEPNNSGSNSTNYGMEKLVGTNYNYWRLCMEAYLQGQDLWDLVDSADSDIPNDTPKNAEPRRKWKIKCGKALFALRTSISKEHIDHIRDVNSPKELDVDEPVSEARLRRYLIRGLRKEYMPFVTSVQGWASQPSVEELENLLSNQEALAKQMSLQTESNDVLFSKENSKSKHFSEAIGGSKNVGESSHSEKNNQLRWKNVRCYRCRQLGHVKRMCCVKLVDENANMVTDEASDQPKWEQCFSSVVAEALANTSATFSAPVNYEKEWIIDSGCSHHVTGNDSLFSELHQHSEDKVIITADNSVHPVEKEGNVCIASERLKEDDIVLSNVYHMPGLRKNLVSVSQITNSGKYVLFGPEDVKILDNVKNIGADVLVVGEKRDSLFVMSAVEAYVEKTSRNDDLMGPTRTLSYSGFRYMMVIVDDFSRYSWVYFLNEKNEAFSKFLEFESTIKREFGSKIRCLRTDNGGEFMSSEFLQHCEAEGINRQMTCPKTPQQNGVVERKIGHMSQVSLSWLHSKNLPRELWAEAMRCACHVINRLPPWLGIKSPFELLYNVKPNVSHLRVFGSICFVHVSKSDRTKLDPKSKKCLFIGYDLNRKGWRCMDPVTKRCITSRNVVFDEVSLYYSPQKLVTEVVDSDFELTEKGVDSTNRELSSQNVECSTHQDDFRARGSTQNSEGILNSSTLENDNEVRCALRRSAREKRHPSYLKDYEVQVNQSTMSSCFFLGAVDNSEPSCYEAAKGKHVIVLLYVDDMIITGDDNVGISCLRNDLSILFEMKILGEIGCFLGLEVQKLEDGYFVSQKGYAQSLLERFNMGESKSMSTPMEPNMKLKKDEGKLLEEGRKFRQLVGSLIYLTITRPEIAYSVGVVSQFMDKPQISHLNAAKRILRYVKGTLEYGLRYKKSDSFILSGFVDADWAGDVNDRRSTTGYCFDTGSAAISWCSKKQHNSISLLGEVSPKEIIISSD